MAGKPQKSSMLRSALRDGPSMMGYRGGTEEPEYTVIERMGSVMIRRYGERVAAEVTVTGADAVPARRAGFRQLAAYIFGDNVAQSKIAMTAPVDQSSQRIEMTAPVAQQAMQKGWRIRFFLPRDLTLSDAPKPNDADVHVVSVPPEYYAVLRFNGSRHQTVVDAKFNQLRTALKESAWHIIGEPVAWFYDPPWTLSFMRRNEVAIAVRFSDA